MGAEEQSSGRSEIEGDWVGTQAFTLREEGCGRVLSTRCRVLDDTLMGSLRLLGRNQDPVRRALVGSGQVWNISEGGANTVS